MKPCQEDWQKLVFKEKIVLFQRNLSSLLNIKQNEKSMCIKFIYAFIAQRMSANIQDVT